MTTADSLLEIMLIEARMQLHRPHTGEPARIEHTLRIE
jgi:hypothetical protein